MIYEYIHPKIENHSTAMKCEFFSAAYGQLKLLTSCNKLNLLLQVYRRHLHIALVTSRLRVSHLRLTTINFLISSNLAELYNL